MSKKEFLKGNFAGATEGYVVAIGASAGGLEAIHEFFDHMPGNSSFSFIIVQHLSSDYKSLLVELVSKHTHMKVFEATENMSLQPDCVYIIPNNKLMTISHSRLKLAEKNHDKAPNTAIDNFLFSLAHDKQEKAIAIILSGTGTDGTKGIEAIKECGGMVIVQDPETARFDGMPKSAITSGNADAITSPARMHEELFAYARQEPLKIFENGKIDDALLSELFQLVHQQSGHDFNLYKTPTIIRRIARRMNFNGIFKLEDYVKLLRENDEEAKDLGKDFLIGVTKFFRDKAAFDILASKVIPEIIDAKEDGDLLKVWICACSTGEEAYSVAILIDRYLQKTGKELEVKIFASDIDEASLEVASHNLYPEAIAKEIDPEILEHYFIKDGKHYSVLPNIRKQIVFARHNVTKAPPFIKNDLICCRNMLIYMNVLLQQKVLSTFHFSLNQRGYLFLGSSETASNIKDGLSEISSKWKIYRKTGPIGHIQPNSYYTSSGTTSISQQLKKTAPQGTKKSIDDVFKDFLTDDLGYVGVFIDKNHEIKETIGDFKKYLSLPDKKLELNILKMVPRELSFMLNTAIRKVWQDNEKASLKRIRIKRNQEDVFVNISINPPVQNSAKPLTLIVFNEVQVELDAKDDITTPIVDHSEQHSDYVMELESELNEVRSNLQMAVEEMETTNEELQSSNEELLSANEELQSSNEELQSLNEELHTLNTEHQLKIKELIDLNDDLNNYFKSVDIGQIFVDVNSHIRKFNPAAVNMVNLIEADIGRPISHISNNIKYDNFAEDINRVQRHHDLVIEKEIELKSGQHCLMRILPYIRKDRQKDGVVITFVDISTVTELSNIVSGVFSTSLSAVLVFNAVRNTQGEITDFECVTANKMASQLLSRPEVELKHALLVKNLPELLQHNLLDKFKSVVDTDTNLQTEVNFDNKGWYLVMATKIVDGFAVTYTNITERKLNEQKLKKNYNELISARENLKSLNNELEDKIKERTLRLSQSEERFKLVSQATNDTIWDWDLASNVMWRSDNFTAMFGYHNNDDTNKINYWFSKIHADDRQRVEQSVHDAINNGKNNWLAEYRFLKADGTYTMILDRGSILHDDYGTPYRMVGSIVDISRITEAEKRVSSSENRFKKIFESNMIGMLFTDFSGNIIDANDAFLQMIGYTAEEVHNGQVNWDKLTPVEYMGVSNKAVNQLKKDGFCPPFEKEYFRKDGTRVPVLMGSARLDDDNLANAVTYVIDLSKQKEVEKNRLELQGFIKKQQDEFYSIFMNAPALISIRRGAELRYEFTNKAFNDFYNRNSFIGKTTREAHIDFASTQLYAGDSKILKNGQTKVGKALNVKRIDPISGQLVDTWLDFLFTPVYNDNGDVDGIAFFGFEVTDLVKAQQATKELMQRKDEFMSIASHELKTPITSLKGSLQIVQRLADQENAVKKIFPFIEKASKQTGKLTALVDDLLDVTRIHAGKMRFNYSWFNAGEMIRECMEDTQSHTPSHKFILSGSTNVQIYADRHRLEQVLSNFMSNAVKYSPDSKEIIVTKEVTDNNMLKLSVQDFGIGIPPEKKDMVFDRFFRVQESSQKFSGLGLGLYITAEIINRHNGKIGVDSVEGEGSTFWFCIPLVQPEEELY
ncbi:chemotaxis protein CheB [Mucilaginibacter sp. PAMB04168]|uniref:chemotaxis protein CheB n=1 Tax=Mucilaginibacter sp. PAMB04168 TaxID=3138567 RepID=UPI0031F6360A